MTQRHVLSISGESTVKIWDAKDSEHPKVHEFEAAHHLGIHHVAASKSGTTAATAGFEGGLKLWDMEELKQIVTLGNLNHTFIFGLF